MNAGTTLITSRKLKNISGEARGTPISVATGLGDHGGVAPRRACRWSVPEGDRQAFESYQRSRRGAGKVFEEPGLLYGCGVGGSGEQQERLRWRAEEWRAAAAETFFEGRIETILREKMGKGCCKAAPMNDATHPEMEARLTEIAKSLEANVTLLDVPGKLDLGRPGERLTILDDKMPRRAHSHAPERCAEISARSGWATGGVPAQDEGGPACVD